MFFILLSLLLSPQETASHPKDSFLTFKGEARSLDDPEKIAYREIHEEIFRNGKVYKSQSTYLNASGEPFAEFRSEYPLEPSIPNYKFVDRRRNYQDSSETVGDELRLSKKKDESSETKFGVLKKKPNHVVGQGFHHFVRLRLDHYLSGKMDHVLLVFPTRFSDYEFRIRKKKVEGNRIVLRLEIDNWFLRLFAPYIEAEYEISTQRIVGYRGPSNILDEDGNVQAVSIKYEYPP